MTEFVRTQDHGVVRVDTIKRVYEAKVNNRFVVRAVLDDDNQVELVSVNPYEFGGTFVPAPPGFVHLLISLREDRSGVDVSRIPIVAWKIHTDGHALPITPDGSPPTEASRYLILSPDGSVMDPCCSYWSSEEDAIASTLQTLMEDVSVA